MDILEVIKYISNAVAYIATFITLAIFWAAIFRKLFKSTIINKPKRWDVRFYFYVLRTRSTTGPIVLLLFFFHFIFMFYYISVRPVGVFPIYGVLAMMFFLVSGLFATTRYFMARSGGKYPKQKIKTHTLFHVVTVLIAIIFLTMHFVEASVV